VQAQGGSMLPRPATGNFPATAARALSATNRSLGGVSGVVLAESHVSAHLPLAASSLQALQDAVSLAVKPPPQVPPGIFRSVVVVLDNLQLLGAGAKGGYFYNVYLNLPFISDAEHARKYFLGTVGAFEVAGASHHGAARLEFQATEVLGRLSAFELQEVTISLVRVSGENPPRGPVLKLGEVRIEISTAPAWDSSSPPDPGHCYC
jgi:tyrosinase